MTIGIQSLAKQSGDSTLLEIRYDGRTLILRLDLGDTGEEVVISAPTKLLRADIPSIRPGDVRLTCHVEVISLNTLLETEHDIFLPAKEFGRFMNQVRLGAGLAFGTKRTETSTLLSLVGYTRLVTCIVESEDEVCVQSPEEAGP